MSTGRPPSLAQRLGHPADARLVLINADDAGMCQAGNAGVLRAIGGMWQRRGLDLEFFTNPETSNRLASAGSLPVGYAELQALTYSSLGWDSH